MASNVLQFLNQIATYSKIQPPKITLDVNSVPTCTYKSKTAVGALNIALTFVESSKFNLTGKTPEEKAQIYEWFEYALLYCTPGNAQVLKELNDTFASKTYLVSDRLTVADIIVYYAVYNATVIMGYLEKEKFAHFSRWFDNMQQDKQLRQKNKTIDFSTNYLASVAPARH